tara:strand:- start:41 stop:340 length:300 start_codon:yes stop_codon:yes gene_type:complete
MNYPSVGDAIRALKSDARVSINNNDVNQITWLDSNPTNISTKQIETKLAELITTYNSLKYQRERASEYPSIVDQLDELYHNGITGWKAKIKTVKDKYPK